jgi:hypothetical protein
VWKRLRAVSAAVSARQRDCDGEFMTEISKNGVAKSGFVRGVKRLRVSGRIGLPINGLERDRSFLETKWETETSTRKREDLHFSPSHPWNVERGTRRIKTD